MSGWQPIETAPKGKEEILAVFGGRVCIARWDAQKYHNRPRPYWTNSEERIWGVNWVRENQPTLWMPLPDPP